MGDACKCNLTSYVYLRDRNGSVLRFDILNYENLRMQRVGDPFAYTAILSNGDAIQGNATGWKWFSSESINGEETASVDLDLPPIGVFSKQICGSQKMVIINWRSLMQKKMYALRA